LFETETELYLYDKLDFTDYEKDTLDQIFKEYRNNNPE
jgi:hypothetical protein